MIAKTIGIPVALIALAAGAPASAQGLKDPIPAPIPLSKIQVGIEPIATGLTAPIFLTVAGEDRGRKFVVDQTGLVLVYRRGAVQPTPFLDITAVIAQLSPAFPSAPTGLNPGYDERGLLGLAFHPGYHDRRSPGFRTLYTLHNVPIGRKADFPEPPFPNAGVAPNCQEVIAEWKVDPRNPDAVEPASYREVLRFDKPEFNHNGGTIAFGLDGSLYAAFGDGGNANDVGPGHNPAGGNAQDLGTILGKVIRINPLDPALTLHDHGALSRNGQYRVPRNNPFFRKPGALGEIYAYGFRNPFRFSFDGDRLILADVGQNNIEEVDVVTRGGNYGWHYKEGTFLFDPTTGGVSNGPDPVPGLINPVVEYDHFEAQAGKITRIAIVGGFVYRGDLIPRLRGKYIFADLNGFVFEANLGTGKIGQILEPGFFVKGIGEDEDRELYLLGSTILGPGGSDGVVARIIPAPPEGRD